MQRAISGHYFRAEQKIIILKFLILLVFSSQLFFPLKATLYVQNVNQPLPVMESRSSVEEAALKNSRCPLRGTGCRNTLPFSSNSTGTPACTEPTALQLLPFTETSTTHASRSFESLWSVFIWGFVTQGQI